MAQPVGQRGLGVLQGFTWCPWGPSRSACWDSRAMIGGLAPTILGDRMVRTPPRQNIGVNCTTNGCHPFWTSAVIQVSRRQPRLPTRATPAPF